MAGQELGSLNLMAFAQGAELANRANWADTFNQMKMEETLANRAWTDQFNAQRLTESRRQAEWSDQLSAMNLQTQQTALDKSMLEMGWVTDAKAQAEDTMKFSANLDMEMLKLGSARDMSPEERAKVQADHLMKAATSLDPNDPATPQRYAAIKSAAQRNVAMLKQNPQAAQYFMSIAGGSLDQTLKADATKNSNEAALSNLLHSVGLGHVPPAVLPTYLALVQYGILRPPGATAAPAQTMSAAPWNGATDIGKILAGASAAQSQPEPATQAAPAAQPAQDAYRTEGRNSPPPAASAAPGTLDWLMAALANMPFAMRTSTAAAPAPWVSAPSTQRPVNPWSSGPFWR